MQDKPYLSVIMPVYNQENYLAETIESVLSQTYKDFEFIILDDGSTDSSAEIIRHYVLKDERILAFFEQNSGKSAATNYLVNEAGGTWCAFLDADDVMLPQRLEKQVAFHHANPEISASSGHCYYINETGRMFGTQRYANLKSITECKKLMGNKLINCSFTGLMVLRQVYLDAGGLMTRFEPCEDYEFVNRLVHNKGYILVIIQEVLMKYRIHPSAISVRKPFFMFDKIAYVKFCLNLRARQLPEINFEEFMEKQQHAPWWVRFNRERSKYSRNLFRKAGFSMLSKDYISFTGQITTASILSPGYVLKRLKNLLRK